ncbi:MAG: pyrimidine/purine nucleoside phosphorylase [Candidatus Deferrimicrobiaceae bacterium]
MKHSVYFDGEVQSLGVNAADGFATVGVIEPGTYTFSTSSEEHIVLTEGTLRVRLPDEDWKVFSKGQEIVVQPKVSFEIEAQADVAYVCCYR